MLPACNISPMRKVIASINITLDGYLSGPDCELDWHFESWSPDMAERLGIELGQTDTILLGRVTYEAMAQYWPGKAREILCPRDDIAFAVMMNRHQKVVYTNTLEKTTWENSILIKGDISSAIRHLKQVQEGKEKNIIIYGSGRLVTELIRRNLIDEYQLWLHPILLGKGRPLFDKLKSSHQLQLLKTKSFQSGVILLQYKVLQEEF